MKKRAPVVWTGHPVGAWAPLVIEGCAEGVCTGVDMCPRVWRRDDGQAAWWDEDGQFHPPGANYCSNLPDLPFHRLESSAVHNQVLSELSNQSSRVVH